MLFAYFLKSRYMEIIETGSLKELKEQSEKEERAFLLIFKSGHEQSMCALENIASAKTDSDIKIFTVDVNSVRDVHPAYSVTSVPTLIEIHKGKAANSYKGCHKPGFFENIFTHSTVDLGNDDKPAQKPVILYSTPTCTWCRTIKDYFRKNNIRFRDIDVSRDQKAAEEMIKRSGQQGVPQTVIGGQVVVGFDKARIDQLLNLN